MMGNPDEMPDEEDDESGSGESEQPNSGDGADWLVRIGWAVATGDITALLS
jgi:hypothetical protein